MGMGRTDGAIEMQRNVRNNTTDMQETIKDLFAWEKDMQAKEQGMKTCTDEPVPKTGPAYRKTTSAAVRGFHRDLGGPATLQTGYMIPSLSVVFFC